MHAVNPPGEYVPAAHGRRSCPSLEGQLDPAGHKKHSEAPANEYHPKGQGRGACCPSGHWNPAGQLAQTAVVRSVRKVPGSHSTGATVGSKQLSPTMHGVHAVALPSE